MIADAVYKGVLNAVLDEPWRIFHGGWSEEPPPGGWMGLSLGGGQYAIETSTIKRIAERMGVTGQVFSAAKKALAASDRMAVHRTVAKNGKNVPIYSGQYTFGRFELNCYRFNFNRAVLPTIIIHEPVEIPIMNPHRMSSADRQKYAEASRTTWNVSNKDFYTLVYAEFEGQSGTLCDDVVFISSVAAKKVAKRLPGPGQGQVQVRKLTLIRSQTEYDEWFDDSGKEDVDAG